MSEYLLTFIIGLVASFLGGMAGGGTGLVSAPFFILMGLPAVSAIATAKFGAVGITVGGLARFRNTPYIRKEYLIPFLILTLIGNVIGATLLLNIDESIATRLVAFMMLGALPFLFLKKDAGLKQIVTSHRYRYFGYVLIFLISILTAAFGGGIGLLIPIIMISLFGLTALEASATRKLPGLIGASLVLLIFIMVGGVIDYKHGIAIFLGTIIGSWIGTHIAVRQGEKFAKVLLGIIIVIMSSKLLLS